MALATNGLAEEKKAKEVKFKDMPKNHWAASSVNDLVRLGVTKGYPDGTFRGSKPVTRYETALFMSKLANSISGEDIKGQMAAMKDDIVTLKKSPPGGLTGTCDIDWKIGNLLSTGSTRGAVACYRLKLTTGRQLGQGADIKVNLDTMDYGYLNDGTTTTGGILAT